MQNTTKYNPKTKGVIMCLSLLTCLKENSTKISLHREGPDDKANVATVEKKRQIRYDIALIIINIDMFYFILTASQ